MTLVSRAEVRVQDRLFIDGAFVDALDGATFSDDRSPRWVGHRGGRPGGHGRRRPGRRGGRGRVPGLGQDAGLGSRPAAPAPRRPHRGQRRGTCHPRVARHRPPDPRQPPSRRPADCGHVPLFRRHGRQGPGRRHPGRARLPELCPARAARRCGDDRALELPAHVLQLEDGPGPGRRQHGGHEARGTDPAERVARRRADGRSRLPAGRRQHRPRPRADRRRALGAPSGRAQDRVHRLHRGRSARSSRPRPAT